MHRSLKLACALALLTAPLQAAPYADPYTSLFIFGDSNSSNGGTITEDRWLYDTAGGAPYQAYEGPDSIDDNPGGTYTNGRPWSSVLADSFSADGKFHFNFAHPGATALPSEVDPDLALALAPVTAPVSAPPPPGTPIFPPVRPSPIDEALGDIGRQFQTFDPGGLPPEADELIGDRPLISMWFGAQDLYNTLDGLKDLSRPALAPGTESVTSPFDDAFAAMEAAANNVVQFIAATMDASPNFNDFQILNLSVAQVIAYLGEDYGFLIEVGDDLVWTFNNQLRNGVNALLGASVPVLAPDGPSAEAAAPLSIVDLNITIVDLDPILLDIYLRRFGPGGPDEGDPLEPCITYGEIMGGRFRESTCPDPTTRLFIDPQHLEGSVHTSLGWAAAGSVGVTPVPLPAGAWLLLGGIGILALRRRRAS